MPLNRRSLIKLAAGSGAACALAPFRTATAGGLWVERAQPMMGTIVAVAVYHEDRDAAARLIGGCFDFMREQVAIITNWSDSSATARLNEERGCVAPPTLAALCSEALRAQHITGGMYAPLCYGLTVLWRAAKEAGSLPERHDIACKLSAISRSRLIREEEKVRIIGPAQLDVNGIGQGFVADLAAAYLKARGVRYGRIDCSGDMRFIGDASWTVEVEHPRSEGRSICSFTVRGDVGIGTSGDYRDYWFVNGKRYHALLDPRSGEPSNECRSVVVLHKSGAVADAVATGLFALPPDRAIEMIRPYGCDALIVDQAGSIHCSAGLRNRISTA